MLDTLIESRNPHGEESTMDQTSIGQDPTRRTDIPIQTGSAPARVDRPSSFRESACRTLHRAAQAVEERTARDGGRNRLVSEYGPRASSFLHRSADSLHDIDAQKVKQNLKSQMEQHPGRSLLAAAAAGLFLGMMFRRR
jgi:hypothetical protein